MRFLTPTEQRLFLVLADGRGHTVEELQACLNDDLSERHLLNNHLVAMRKKLSLLNLYVVYYGDMYTLTTPLRSGTEPVGTSEIGSTNSYPPYVSPVP